MIEIIDTLLLPDGNPLVDAEISIKTLKSEEILTGTSISITTSDTGGFKTKLHNGVFEIRVVPRFGHVVMEKKVEVTPQVVSSISLIALVNNHAYTEE